jgi:hypothetical protein
MNTGRLSESDRGIVRRSSTRGGSLIEEPAAGAEADAKALKRATVAAAISR